MFTLVIFIVSFALLVSLLIMKSREVCFGRKIFLENVFLRCDVRISWFLLKIKSWLSHINYKNIKLIFFWIVVNMKKLIVTIKRRFDHQQSHFFTKKDHDAPKNKGSVSFFLKDVSDYKKGLRGDNKSSQ